MGSVFQDIAVGVRNLARSPRTSITIIIILALGIGLNTGIFAVVRTILLQRLPFPFPDRLVELTDPGSVLPNGATRAAFAELQSQLFSFEAISGFSVNGVNLTANHIPTRIQAAEVSANFMADLGEPPELGRSFLSSEDEPGHDRVALISSKLWHSTFASQVGVIGTHLYLNGISYTIIGVMPEAQFPNAVDVWSPSLYDPQSGLREGSAYEVGIIGRLRAHVTLTQANHELDRALTRITGSTSPPTSAVHVALLSRILTQSIRPALLILFYAVLLVTLLASLNVSGILLSRTLRRSRDIALRLAIGSSRHRLIRQQFVECLALSTIGASLSFALAMLTTRFLYHFAPLISWHVSINAIPWSVFAYTVGIIVIVSGISTIVPAIALSTTSPATTLKGAVVSGPRQLFRYGESLVFLQFVLSALLLVNCGLLLKTLVTLDHVRLGYKTDNILTFSVALHGEPYLSPDHFNDKAIASFYRRALEALSQLPHVNALGAASVLPLTDTQDIALQFAPASGETLSVFAFPRAATRGYLGAIGIPILDGSDFSESTDLLDAKTAIITEDLATLFWPHGRAIGKKVECVACSSGPFTVIGVIPNRRQRSVRSPSLIPEVYLNFTSVPWMALRMNVAVASILPPATMIPMVRKVFADIDKGQPLFDIRTMAQREHEQDSLLIFELWTIAAFSIMALTLAAVGLYASVSYTITRQLKSYAIRVALGAPLTTIRRSLFWQCIFVSTGGCVVGLLVSLATTSIWKAHVYYISTIGPSLATLIIILFTLIAVAATYMPIRRLASLEAASLLRSD